MKRVLRVRWSNNSGGQGREGRAPTDASRLPQAMDGRCEANANAPVPQWSGGRLEFVEIAVWSRGSRGRGWAKVIGISRSKKESKSRTVEESKKVETAALVGVGLLPGKGGATRRETSESPRSKKMSRMSRITRGRKMMKREGERGVSPGAEQKSRKPSQAKPVIQTRGRWGPHFMTPAGRHPVCQRVPACASVPVEPQLDQGQAVAFLRRQWRRGQGSLILSCRRQPASISYLGYLSNPPHPAITTIDNT